MNKPWIGYLSSLLLLLAGILMIVCEKVAIGIVFIALAVLGLVLKVYMNRSKHP